MARCAFCTAMSSVSPRRLRSTATLELLLMFRGPLTLTVACDGLSLLMVESAAAAFATGWRCGRITCPKVHGVLEALDTEQAGENQHLECVFCAVKSLHLPMLCRWGFLVLPIAGGGAPRLHLVPLLLLPFSGVMHASSAVSKSRCYRANH